MEPVAHALTPLPHLAPSHDGSARRILGPFTLAIVACTDIASPRHHAGSAPPVPGGSPSRLLQLSDGQTQCSAFEWEPPLSDAQPGQLCPGAIIQLGEALVFGGILLLRPRAITLLQGTPRALSDTSQANTERRRKLWLSASDVDDTDPPPRFSTIDAFAAARQPGAVCTQAPVQRELQSQPLPHPSPSKPQERRPEQKRHEQHSVPQQRPQAPAAQMQSQKQPRSQPQPQPQPQQRAQAQQPRLALQREPVPQRAPRHEGARPQSLCEEAPKVLSQPAIDPELLKDLLSTGLHIEEVYEQLGLTKLTPEPLHPEIDGRTKGARGPATRKR
mmetsp:Transcript_53786/g.123752  ORF Transcript_53786/g.123752 Transcript_53786/m.123752 type:complete len:331 (-) Transcript_53786:303-1295(-)